MEIEARIDHLSDEIADVKTEVRQLMLEMGRLLDKVDASTAKRHSTLGSRVPTYKKARIDTVTPSSWVDKSFRANDALKRSGTTMKNSRKNGGLNLTEQELTLVLSKLKLDLDDGIRTHNGRFSLDELAKTIKEVKSNSQGGIQGANDQANPTIMSLENLAKTLRRSIKDTSTGAGRSEKEASQSGGFHPARSNTLLSGRTKMPSERFDNMQEDELGLDVNLMANLMRWVGSVKLKLGVQGLQSLLELYGLTGHLTPAVENAVARIAKLDVLPDESNSHIFTVDDLIDAYLQLHSINYGSGRTPAARVNDYDRSTMWSWTFSSKTKPKPEVPKGNSPETPTKANTYGFSKLLKTPEASANVPDFVKDTSGNVFKPEDLSQEVNETQAERSASNTLDPDVETTKQLENIDFADPVYERSGQLDSDNSGFPKESDTIHTREAYFSDVTDAEWFQLESLIPTVKPGGRPGKYDRREIVNGILYHERTGCSWRKLPDDLPPWRIVYHYYREWSVDGTWMVVIESLDAHRRRSDSRLRQDRLAGWIDVKSKGHAS